ncbi:MAG: DegT/DnrJ/EryC1/StrS family aminotransferase [Betaproteobacteria bacterium]|nr:DegT/DnrJ/EryC1/StrS family aminotransferase [Betaproteobacteria bacterium]
MNIRLSRSIVGEAEAQAVRRVLIEDGYLGMGTEVRLFEEELAVYLNRAPEHVIAVNSGTAALHLAVQAMVEPGCEVLVPSLTFVASFQSISAAGCVPVACDAREDNAIIDLEDAKTRITPRTRAIMPVHYASNPAGLEAIYEFARKHKLRVIEDAAHAFGCRHKGRRIGSFGDVICFSFDGIKNITCGEGGCIVTVDPEVARRCRDARLLAVQNDTQARYSGARSWDFDVNDQGYRYHMSNLMAAIGRVQLSRLENEFAPKRTRLAAIYRERLADLHDIAFFQNDPEDEIVPHIAPVRVLHGRRDRVKADLAEAGIPTGIHYKPNHLLRRYGGGKSSLPTTERLYSELMTLPLHPGLSEDQIEHICALLRKALAIL